MNHSNLDRLVDQVCQSEPTLRDQNIGLKKAIVNFIKKVKSKSNGSQQLETIALLSKLSKLPVLKRMAVPEVQGTTDEATRREQIVGVIKFNLYLTKQCKCDEIQAHIILGDHLKELKGMSDTKHGFDKFVRETFDMCPRYVFDELQLKERTSGEKCLFNSYAAAYIQYADWMNTHPRFQRVPISFSDMRSYFRRFRKWFESEQSRSAPVTSYLSAEYWKTVEPELGLLLGTTYLQTR
ncbi:hypothetical protein HK100_006243 [Physocladia obscura]|uniref:Uncharacterized protein n=1 Tax=Physocladia obscura TaxID=109957 RepID=A0AAD5T759_9FUNG|nr:hypothetical protein HK100_006243 [Physocladia obscura]